MRWFAAGFRIADASRRAAESPLSDEEARAQLQSEVDANPRAARKHIRLLAQLRGDYIADRQYRLLLAAYEGQPVEPMPAERADVFRREEALGRMPLRDAFAELKRLEPSLATHEDRARAGEFSTRDDHIPLGRTVAYEDELLRSDIALSIATIYCDELASGGDVERPYFGTRRRLRGIITGTFIGGPQPPPSAQA